MLVGEYFRADMKKPHSALFNKFLRTFLHVSF
jgi:hypothetical protein